VDSNHRYVVASTDEIKQNPTAAGASTGLPRMSQAGTMLSVATTAAMYDARRKVVIGSPLTLTSTFQVPWKIAATRANPTAIAIIDAGARAACRAAGRPRG